MDESTSKACIKCEQVKPVEQFYVRRGKPQARCKRCVLDQNDAYRKANPEVSRASARRWRERNPEKAKAGFAKWLEANRDYNRKRHERWRLENPEVLAAIRARYYADGDLSDKAREYSAKRRALVSGASIGKVSTDELWDSQGNVCPLCSEQIDRSIRHPDPMSPSLDHIFPLIAGGAHSQENLQWVHLVCNQRKGSSLPAA